MVVFFNASSARKQQHKGRTIRKVHEFFFQMKPSARIFFSNKYCIFSQWNLDSLSVFVLYKLFYTHNRSIKGCRPFFNHVWKIFSKMYWEEEVTLIGRFPCAFFSPCSLEASDKNGVTGLQNFYSGVIAALGVLFELVHLQRSASFV